MSYNLSYKFSSTNTVHRYISSLSLFMKVDFHVVDPSIYCVSALSLHIESTDSMKNQSRCVQQF